MEWRKEELRFSTGKVISANRRLISISPSFEVGEGYNGTLSYLGAEELFTNFTKEEKIELSNYMKTLWEDFKYT
jgi:hypothetical protein